MMKLIIRADDLGFSEAVNYGIEKSIKNGVVTSVGIMPNMKYAIHGYNLVKDYSIALGLHTNICVGKPLSNRLFIPSLVQDNGYFYSSQQIRQRKEDSININEAEIEIEAQLKRFKEITGKYPDYLEGHAVASQNFFLALINVAKKYHLTFGYPINQKDNLVLIPFAKKDKNGLYNPQQYMENNLSLIQKSQYALAIFHPGYLDQDILNNSSFTLIRPMECQFLCSQWLKEWLAFNQIELIDYRSIKP